MKRMITMLALVTLFASTSFAEKKPMTLVGQGDVRYMGFIKVYDAYLFTPKPQDHANILANDVSKCLLLDYAVSLSAADFIKSADAILKKQHLPERLQGVQLQIDAINGAYRAVAKGDQYRLCYDGASFETTMTLNDEQLVTVKSAEFGEIYFGMWLGPNNPIDSALRSDLLNIK